MHKLVSFVAPMKFHDPVPIFAFIISLTTKEPRTFVAPKKKTVCSCKGVGGFEVQMLEISVDFEI